MPKRVAITIAGAVSLGSYEAGVIYELLEAFRGHNQRTQDRDARIYVDVLTGASAGGMTAAMLAQRLMFDGGSMGSDARDASGDRVCAHSNPLYHAWVERVSLEGLAKMQRDERKLKWHSLLSSDLITKIGNEMLVDWLAAGKPMSGPHAAVECDANGVPLPLDVGLALTNLNGVDYQLPVAGNPDGGFNYTRGVDQMLFRVQSGDRGAAAMWQRLRGGAVACGAFPAAFRSQALERKCSEYGKRVPVPPAMGELGETHVVWDGPDPKPFAYCDGGVLQNQPLGIAKNFVDARVRAAQDANNPDAHEIADERLYVFVSPNAVKSDAQKNLKAENLTIGRELIELFHTYIRQSQFHDWIIAEGLNTQIDVLDKRATQLADQIALGGLNVEALKTSAAQLNGLLITDTGQRQKTVDRLQKQYAKEYANVLGKQGQTAADAFIQAMATLESAADLGLRDKMQIVAVMANGRTELAGSGIAAFVGFFSEEFRKHDYWVGRVKTRQYLVRPDVKAILGVKDWGEDEEEWKKPLPNPGEITTLPLPLGDALRPGRRWIWHIVWLRFWPFLVTGLVLLVLLLLQVFRVI
jgi:predicted acylesterase/phospholipase RssA